MQKIWQKPSKAVLAVVALLVLAAVFASAYFLLRPQAAVGGKTIHVEITSPQAAAKSLELRTDAEYLRQALEENGLIQGTEGAFGLFVTSVDGLAADDSRQEWWRFSKNGEALTASVDATPIHDGDRYEIALVSGY